MNPGQLLDFAAKLTLTVALLGVIYGMGLLIYGMAVKKWWAPGWVLAEKDERIARLEARIERYEQILTRTIDPLLPPDRKGR